MQWLAVVLVFAALVATATLWNGQLEIQALPLRAEIRKLSRVIDQAHSKMPEIPHYFGGDLPQIAPNPAAIDSLQRTADEANVRIISLSLRQAPSQSNQLGRLELAVAAQGTTPH